MDTNYYVNNQTQPYIGDESLERLKTKNLVNGILSRVFYIAVAIILFTVFIIGCGAIFLRVERVNVVGARRVDPHGIVDASGIQAKDNLYGVDRADIAAAVMERFPYISDVHVSRLLPTTLQIEVSEDRPIYYTSICGEYFVLSSTMRVLEKTADFAYIETFEPALKHLLIPDCIYAVVGEEIVFANRSVSVYAKELLVKLEIAEMFDQLTEIDFSKRFSIYVTYCDRWRIYLGDSGDIDTKLTFAGMMIETFDEEQSGEVDAHDVSVGSVILNNKSSSDE